MRVVEDGECKRCPSYCHSTGQGTIPKRLEEYLRNINAGIELAALNSKNSVSGISKVVCSRRSDRGDTTKRCEKKKKKTTEWAGEG